MSFFVERRLNGFNPGNFRLSIDKPWKYEIKFDLNNYPAQPSGVLPTEIEARFVLEYQKLHLHSIKYCLKGNIVTSFPGDKDWEWSKTLFRSTEFIFQESQTHLARTHLNVEQYAMAFYRNVSSNPIRELLEPHFEGLLNINKLGDGVIFGSEGVIPVASPLEPKQVDSLLINEVARLNYHTWHPRHHILKNFVINNHYDRAALAFWDILEHYVSAFFKENSKGISEYWKEIEAMSQDLVTHSILKKELGTLAINNIQDLKKLCIYVIYHSSFLHSWVNYKQYEDGGDIEYASIGLWDSQDPDFDGAEVLAGRIKQVLITWTLSSVKYNPIMETGSTHLKDLLWGRRRDIEPGIPLENIMMSIHI